MCTGKLSESKLESDRQLPPELQQTVSQHSTCAVYSDTGSLVAMQDTKPLSKVAVTLACSETKLLRDFS